MPRSPFKRRLMLAPRSDMTRFYLACLYGRTGRHEEARAIGGKYWGSIRAFPVDHLRRSLPTKIPIWMDRMVEGLRKAGVSI